MESFASNKSSAPGVAMQRFKPAMFNGQSIGIPGATSAPNINVNDPSSIAAAVQNASNAANNANNQRYSQGLNVLTGGFNSALANMGSYGTREKQGLKNQLAFNNGKSAQDSISRGLDNTTVRSGMLAQNQRTFNEGMTGVNENVARDRNALLTGGANTISNFIANRNDAGPDLGTYASLIQQAQANQQPQQQNVIRTQNGSLSGNSWDHPAIRPLGDGNSGGGDGGGPISQAIGGNYMASASGVNVNNPNPLAALAASGVNIGADMTPKKPCRPPFVC